MIETNNLDCPFCGEKDQVIKISAFIMTDSPLAQHLRPPDRPSIPSIEEFSRHYSLIPEPVKDFDDSSPILPLLVSIASGIFGVILLITTLAQNSSNSVAAGIITFVIFGIISAIFGYIYFLKNKGKGSLIEKKRVFEESLRVYRLKCEQREENIRTDYESIAGKNFAAWKKAKEKWELLYYCRRDNLIFIPGTSKYAPVQEFQTFIYSEGA